MRLDHDLHVHTYYSPCARREDAAGQPAATPERYFAQAPIMGLRLMVFTDHFVEDPTAPGMVQFYKGSGPAILRDLRAELARLETPSGLEILIGCETDTLAPGVPAISQKLAEQLDFVLVPTTHYHLTGIPQPRSFAPTDVAAHMLTMLESVVRLGWVDAIAHPFDEGEALVGDLRRIYDVMDKRHLDEILGLAADKGVALEVNGSAINSPNRPNYPAMYLPVVQRAKELGVRFTFGSDAHSLDMLGASPENEAWFALAGLEAGDFITPRELRACKGR
jgi:histidinol phosphatase-like PHP family hydrolase